VAGSAALRSPRRFEPRTLELIRAATKRTSSEVNCLTAERILFSGWN